MSQATERTKQAEADYKKIFTTRLIERKKEQTKKNIENSVAQTIGIKKALQRKIKKRRNQ